MMKCPQEGNSPTPRLLRTLLHRVRTAAERTLSALDAACNRIYGWRLNPLYQSGAAAFVLLLVLIVTGIYLLVFYRVSSPWESVQRIQADPYLGRWMRSLHRFASDALVVAVAVHAFRMFAQDRAWGPRALAWISGVIMLLLVFVSGWTGFVIVWDTFGARLAIAGASLFDALPVLSEPVRRIFSGEHAVPPAFFFINLFLHVAIPLVAAAGLWIHLARVARPVLLPPRTLALWMIGALMVLSVLLPVPLLPQQNPFSLPDTVQGDLFYAFWLSWAERLPAWVTWSGAIGTLSLGLLVPAWNRRARTGRWAPSSVDPRLCTGCMQCPQDCPWDAITMQPRNDDRPTLLAHVDPARCVSCGICAGSCAPMGIGPPGHSGRDQLEQLRSLLAETPLASAQTVACVACEYTPPHLRTALAAEGAWIFAVPCAGNLHTSVIETLLRSGAAGVLVVSCPPRDCRGREGPKWLEQRVYHDREAELQARVDRRRIRLAVGAPGDIDGAMAHYRSLARSLAQLDATDGEDLPAASEECERASIAPTQESP
jgi:Pyruvate/2-oxoacid:ferredoxin oxidoreductase delta subunit/coenzyme F420-reducing hydrogenase delta subunit